MDMLPANLLRRPRPAVSAPWIALNATAMNGPAVPGGGGRSVRLVEAGTKSTHEIRQGFAAAEGATYSLSCLGRADTRHWLNLSLLAGETEWAGAWFDLRGGAFGEVGLDAGAAAGLGVAMEVLADGWYLCRMTCRLKVAPPGGSLAVRLRIGDAQGRGTYRGNGAGAVCVAEVHAGLVMAADHGGPAAEVLANTALPALRAWVAEDVEAPEEADGGSVDGGAVDGGAAPVVRVRPVAILRSPDFAVRYPDIANAEIVDWGARHAMEQSWLRGHFAARPVEVLRVPGGYVCEEGLVFDAALRVVAQSTQYHRQEVIDACRDELRARLAVGQVNLLPGAGIVVKRPASHNYGHYLAEMFSRAVLVTRLLGDYRLAERRPAYIVNRLVPGVLDAVYQSLRQVGVGLDQWVAQDHAPLWCEELFFADGVTEHGTYMSPLSVGAMELAASGIAPGPRRRLFVTRRSAQGRGLVNEAHLAERLAAAGFHAVEPGEMSFQEQVAAFRGASAVVGVLGAAMTNIGFCDPGTPVAVITAATFPDTFFWFIAQHKAMPYTEVRCDLAPGSDRTMGSPEFIIRDADIGMLEGFGSGG